MATVGLLGHPVGHSLSPRLHEAAFRAAGLDWHYELRDVPPAELPEAVSRARTEGWRGWNVTLPHKQAIIPLLTGLTPTARQAGAVNTVTCTADGLYGDNTDIVGFARALTATRWSGTGSDTSALLLGAGGAARAVLVHLLELGLQVVIVNRTPPRALALAQEFTDAAAQHGAALTALPEPQVPQAVAARSRLVIHATASGRDTPQWLPLDAAATPTDALFFDLNYDLTALTPFCRTAQVAGRQSVDGLRMLVEQAAAAFSRWTDRPAPLGAMLAAVGRHGEEGQQ